MTHLKFEENLNSQMLLNKMQDLFFFDRELLNISLRQNASLNAMECSGSVTTSQEKYRRSYVIREGWRLNLTNNVQTGFRDKKGRGGSNPKENWALEGSEETS